jgi:hypothetical protein
MQAFVRSRPDIVLTSDPATISEMKERIREWEAALADGVRTRLEREFAWSYAARLSPAALESGLRPFYEGREVPDSIDRVVRPAMGGIGTIVAMFGWESIPSSSWGSDGDDDVTFVGVYEVPTDVAAALRSYSDARRRYFRLVDEHQRLEALEARHEAQAAADQKRAEEEESLRLWNRG